MLQDQRCHITFNLDESDRCIFLHGAYPYHCYALDGDVMSLQGAGDTQPEPVVVVRGGNSRVLVVPPPVDLPAGRARVARGYAQEGESYSRPACCVGRHLSEVVARLGEGGRGGGSVCAR